MHSFCMKRKRSPLPGQLHVVRHRHLLCALGQGLYGHLLQHVFRLNVKKALHTIGLKQGHVQAMSYRDFLLGCSPCPGAQALGGPAQHQPV